MKVGGYVLILSFVSICDLIDLHHISHFFVIQAKLSRLVEACTFFIANGARSVFLNVTGVAGGNEDETPSNGQ